MWSKLIKIRCSNDKKIRRQNISPRRKVFQLSCRCIFIRSSLSICINSIGSHFSIIFSILWTHKWCSWELPFLHRKQQNACGALPDATWGGEIEVEKTMRCPSAHFDAISLSSIFHLRCGNCCCCRCRCHHTHYAHCVHKLASTGCIRCVCRVCGCTLYTFNNFTWNVCFVLKLGEFSLVRKLFGARHSHLRCVPHSESTKFAYMCICIQMY